MKIKIMVSVYMVFSGMLYGMESKNKSQIGLVLLEKKIKANPNLIPQTEKALEDILYLLFVGRINARDAAVREMIKNAFLAESQRLNKSFERTGLAGQFWSCNQDDDEEIVITPQNTLRQRRVTHPDQDKN
jgi:hypothetical protein